MYVAILFFVWDILIWQHRFNKPKEISGQIASIYTIAGGRRMWAIKSSTKLLLSQRDHSKLLSADILIFHKILTPPWPFPHSSRCSWFYFARLRSCEIKCPNFNNQKGSIHREGIPRYKVPDCQPIASSRNRFSSSRIMLKRRHTRSVFDWLPGKYENDSHSSCSVHCPQQLSKSTDGPNLFDMMIPIFWVGAARVSSCMSPQPVQKA